METFGLYCCRSVLNVHLLPGYTGVHMTMCLTDLVAALPQAEIWGDMELSVRALTCDSRHVRPGSLFVA